MIGELDDIDEMENMWSSLVSILVYFRQSICILVDLKSYVLKGIQIFPIITVKSGSCCGFLQRCRIVAYLVRCEPGLESHHKDMTMTD